MADSFSTFERRFVQPYRSGFARLVGPLLRLLVALHVPPNAVSATQIVLGVIIVAIMGQAPQLAFVLFIVTLLLDSLDGALARSYGRLSRFGALFDQICDHVRETLVILALATIGVLHVSAAVLYPLVYILFNFLLFLCNHQKAPVPWAFKSYLIVYPAFFLYAFFGLWWLTPAVVLSMALMTVTILIALRNLSQVMDVGDVMDVGNGPSA